MKAARLVVLGVALAAGGMAAYFAAGQRPSEPPKPVVQLETVDILVAKTDLGRGQVIGQKDVDWQIWPAAAANASFIRKTSRPNAIDQFVGAIVRIPVAAGEPIRDPAVVFAKAGGFLAAVLPQGMRAVSLAISAESGAGGFILPEDHVDMVLTRRDRTAERATGIEKYVTETILRNVRVLAVDQAVEEKGGQKVVVGKTATVELTLQQAEALELARQIGTIALALRSLVDSKSTTPEGAADEGNDSKGAVNTVRYGVSTLGASH